MCTNTLVRAQAKVETTIHKHNARAYLSYCLLIAKTLFLFYRKDGNMSDICIFYPYVILHGVSGVISVLTVFRLFMVMKSTSLFFNM